MELYFINPVQYPVHKTIPAGPRINGYTTSERDLWPQRLIRSYLKKYIETSRETRNWNIYINGLRRCPRSWGAADAGMGCGTGRPRWKRAASCRRWRWPAWWWSPPTCRTLFYGRSADCTVCIEHYAGQINTMLGTKCGIKENAGLLLDMLTHMHNFTYKNENYCHGGVFLVWLPALEGARFDSRPLLVRVWLENKWKWSQLWLIACTNKTSWIKKTLFAKMQGIMESTGTFSAGVSG